MIKATDLIALFAKALEEKWGYIMGTYGQIWTQAKQNQKVSYMRNQYGENWKTSSAAKESKYYYAALYGAKWIGRKVADCSGLFRWAYEQYGEKIYHGSNTIWNSYCKAKGEMKNGRKANGEELKPGTAVFVYRKEKDKRSHIGLYVGDGMVIEASDTQSGVITSPVTKNKWVEWGELKAVDYEGGDEPLPVQKPILRKGDRGEYVTLAQTQLIQKGYDCGKWGADGVFGAATEEAVKRFQIDAGLTADGVIGKTTWEALEKPQPVTILYTVHIPHLTTYKAEALVNQYPGASMTEERG